MKVMARQSAADADQADEKTALYISLSSHGTLEYGPGSDTQPLTILHFLPLSNNHDQ